MKLTQLIVSYRGNDIFSALNSRNRHKKQEKGLLSNRSFSLSLWERAGVRVGEAIRKESQSFLADVPGETNHERFSH